MLQRFFAAEPQRPLQPLILHPRAAPPGHLRVWAGSFGSAPTPPRWSLDGRAVAPTALHAGGDGLQPTHDHGARSFTGVFELGPGDGVRAGHLHRLQLEVSGRTAALELEALPASIPESDALRVLLVSCYHQAEDPAGAVGDAVSRIPEAQRPHLSLLMGDQVYLDLPTIADFPSDEANLARRFERDYSLNWSGTDGYARLLAAAPSLASPDDHEYWNNFPHASPIIQNSWTSDGRTSWKNAADALFDAYQLARPAARGDELVLDIEPLSILMLDQRSQRNDEPRTTLADGVLDRVEAWVDRLLADRLYGAVVTGQSLLDEPMSELQGNIADFTLANYGDYAALLGQLDRLAAAGRPVLLLTGDVHWGRVTQIREGGRVRFYEVISSPSSLVTTVGSDQLSGLGEGVRRLFGREPDPWWRHADPEDPPQRPARHVLGPRTWCRCLHKQKGNQVAMLGLRRRGGGLEMTVTYYPITDYPNRRTDPPVVVGPYSLPSH
ncbi:MAG: hypothetical protein AAGC60_13835 [Acidobacteriota bacterium]